VEDINIMNKRDGTMPSETVQFEENFQERLKEVLDMRQGIWWEKQLGVSNSLIGSRWKKGTLPRADKLIKICQLTGVSANWLFLGIEPKFIGDEITPDGGVQEIRDKMKDFVSLHIENRNLKRHIAQLSENEKAIDHLISIVRLIGSKGDFIENIDEMKQLPNEEFFDRYVAPFNVFIKSFSDIIFKLLAIIMETESGKDFIIESFRSLSEDYEKNRLMFSYRLKELDLLFSSQKFVEQLKHLNRCQSE